MSDKFDVIVVGGGPGGYVAAIKAAKEGMQVALVENVRVGGTCLNRGCIPAKAMIHASSLYREMKEAEKFGVSASDVSFNYSKILEYKQGTTDQLVQGIEQLLKANGVTLVSGHGTLLGSHRVQVEGEEIQVLEARNIILAAGSKPFMLPLPGMDLKGVLSSDELFKLEEMPEIAYKLGIVPHDWKNETAGIWADNELEEAVPLRGSGFSFASGGGAGALFLNYPRSSVFNGVSFRSALFLESWELVTDLLKAGAEAHAGAQDE